MKIMAEAEVKKALEMIWEQISVAARTRKKDLPTSQIAPRLVAVSKTKPAELVKAAYEAGQRHFGENYVQELEEKSKTIASSGMFPEIRWHFIGHLQSNKVSKVVGVPNLWMVETVDRLKLATALDKAWAKLNPEEPLKIMLQVNTSQEENKSGCHFQEAPELFKSITDSCPNLKLMGLMTIGAFDHDLTQGPNPDFLRLLTCRDDICSKLGLDPTSMEISMGMSNDYQHAIELGSTNVRVGSKIFGVRDYASKT